MEALEKLRLPLSLAGLYQPLAVVGEGGFGVVYRARQNALGRLVALKILHRQFLDDPERRERFTSEARMVSKLAHPSVVPVLDFGLARDAAYIAFPYLDGGSLRARLDRGPLPWLEAFPHLMSMLEALEYIHREGIVHRDLKPENVLLDASGRAQLTDFGISKPARSTVQTGSGIVLGTPGYLPPEVLASEPPAPSTDLFAVGVIAWEMLCGRRPYQLPEAEDNGSPAAILEELRAGREGPPHGLPPGTQGLPLDLDRWLDRLLEPRRAQRFASATDAIAQLTEIADGHSQTRARARRKKPTATTGGGTLIASAQRRDTGTMVAPPEASTGLRALALFGGMLAAALALRFATRPGPPPEVPVAPVSVAASSAAPPEGPEPLIARMVQQVEAAPIAVRPWGGHAGPGDYECPLVVSAGRVARLSVRADPDCRLIALNGKPLVDRGAAWTEVDPAVVVRGINWLRVGAPEQNAHAATARVEPAPGSAPVPPPAPIAEAHDYDELRCIVNGPARDPQMEARAYLVKHTAGEPLMQEVGDQLIELNVQAAWNRNWDAPQVGLVSLVEDAYWAEPDTLAMAIKMLDTVQRALARWPQREVLWQNLGWLLRRSRQPEAARVALVEALRLWPRAHWAWFELAQLERKLADPESAGLLTGDETLERVRASAEDYDWAGRLFAAAGSGLPEKTWRLFRSTIARRRAGVAGALAKVREAQRPETPNTVTQNNGNAGAATNTGVANAR